MNGHGQYYSPVPPVNNGYYYPNQHQRRQPPPTAVAHTLPQQQAYAPYVPIHQPIHQSQHHPQQQLPPRPPTIVSSTPTRIQPPPPPPPPPPPALSAPQPTLIPPPPSCQPTKQFTINKIPLWPSPGILPWVNCEGPFPERRQGRRILASEPKQPVPAPTPVAIASQGSEVLVLKTIIIAKSESEAEPVPPSLKPAAAPPREPTTPISATNTIIPAPIAIDSTAPASAAIGSTKPISAQPAKVPEQAIAPPPALPIIPLVPAVPVAPPKAPAVPKATGDTTAKTEGSPKTASAAVQENKPPATAAVEEIKPPVAAVIEESKPTNPPATVAAPTPPPPAVPKVASSWANIVKSSTGGAAVPPAAPKVNGTVAGVKTPLSDLLKSFEGTKLSAPILEPRGLVNTGNMCFMNSVLQMLIFCSPFYHFLDLLGKNVTHSFKGDTPLIDTMVVFLREFRVVGSPHLFEKLTGFRQKEYLEAFGEPFVPEFVYGALRDIPRFASMRRGHQHDAEEFLGFLLDELHEEVVKVQKKAGDIADSSPAVNEARDDGWLEVGHKQKVASTRTTTILESPITKIFGGKLRSEFRVKGLQPSVTLEPYQPLQLDIQSPHVFTIVDALKQLTKPEVIHGSFKSPRGTNDTATKTVYIETLPPVLILHLKRFQYDNKGGTQKLWKKIGYPLQLDFPKDTLSPNKRAGPQARYKLIGVVYHHGKSASGGHYTVDVQRQDGKNWIRLDDTVIKRVHANDVKVDLKEVRAANGTDTEEEGGWENVGSGAADGTTTPNGTQLYSKDSKVAYILFYQRI